MENSFFHQYSEFENSLMEKFRHHPFFLEFEKLRNAVIVDFLLQLGHLSAEFVRWYERAKQGLDDEQAKEVIRGILRDEIPLEVKIRHVLDLLADKESVGNAVWSVPASHSLFPRRMSVFSCRARSPKPVIDSNSSSSSERRRRCLP